jgi:Contact-dependent growth inhibition CdiA C-terminal domain
MSNLNKLKFDNYPLHSYFKTNEKAEKHFKDLNKFPDALGYNIETNGFIVLHHKHQSGGILDEMGACIFLKNQGHGIELMMESDFIPSPDVKIKEITFDIKNLKNATNLDNAIMMQFRRTYKKANNIVLHISQSINEVQLKTALRKASKFYSEIKMVWLIYNHHLFILNKEMMRAESYKLKKER